MILIGYEKSVIYKNNSDKINVCLFVCLFVFYVPLQRGHLETAPPFTVPCEGRAAR